MPFDRKNGGAVLDEVDVRLIAALEQDARASLADLARAVGLSPQSVSERLKRLEDREIVRGFAVVLDPKRLGLAVGAYIRIQPMTGELARVAKLIVQIPEVIECDRITGDDCF